MDINSDPGCYGTTDPDMSLSSSPDPDGSMTLADSSGHSDQKGPGGGTALGHPHAYKL